MARLTHYRAGMAIHETCLYINLPITQFCPENQTLERIDGDYHTAHVVGFDAGSGSAHSVGLLGFGCHEPKSTQECHRFAAQKGVSLEAAASPPSSS